MKNYASKKYKYDVSFADAIMDKFRNLRYGIKSCNRIQDLDHATMRYELAQWQSSGDYSSLSEIRSNYKKWMPVNLCEDDMCYININVSECKDCAKSFHITTAQTVWTITHNLGFNPNITTTDDSREEIVGIVEYVNSNIATITFSQPVTGWAYAS